MEITEEKTVDITIVAIHGKLDTTNFGELEKYLIGILKKNETKILIDCEKLDYIASSGLRVFLITLKQIKKTNGKLILCSLNAFVKEVFEMSGFSTLFTIHSSREEALNSF